MVTYNPNSGASSLPTAFVPTLPQGATDFRLHATFLPPSPPVENIPSLSRQAPASSLDTLISYHEEQPSSVFSNGLREWLALVPPANAAEDLAEMKAEADAKIAEAAADLKSAQDADNKLKDEVAVAKRLAKEKEAAEKAAEKKAKKEELLALKAEKKAAAEAKKAAAEKDTKKKEAEIEEAAEDAILAAEIEADTIKAENEAKVLREQALRYEKKAELKEAAEKKAALRVKVRAAAEKAAEDADKEVTALVEKAGV